MDKETYQAIVTLHFTSQPITQDELLDVTHAVAKAAEIVADSYSCTGFMSFVKTIPSLVVQEA